MTPKLALIIIALISSSLLTACQRYAVSLNQKSIYTPPGLFKNYQITDEALKNCVAQTILDSQITKAENLTRLNCSHANITSLAGIGKFYALHELNLDNNNLQRIDEIAHLGRLERLYLAQNNIKDGAPLLSLLHLKKLVIDGNGLLDCVDLQQLTHNQDETFEITLPKQCMHAEQS
jgi:Leucine-rich repeat (LRR) protein